MTDYARTELVGTYLECARGYVDRAAGLIAGMPASTRDSRHLAASELVLAMEDLRRAEMHLRAFPEIEPESPVGNGGVVPPPDILGMRVKRESPGLDKGH